MAGEHTPGPWTVQPAAVMSEEPHMILARVRDFDVLVCESYGIEDARLIAASPDMLAALRFVSKYAAMQAGKGEPLPSQLTGAIEASIAKAEGASHVG